MTSRPLATTERTRAVTDWLAVGAVSIVGVIVARSRARARRSGYPARAAALASH